MLEADGRQHKLDHASGLSQDQILSLCEDREKNLWVGTVHGLNRLSRRVVKMIAPPDNWQNRAVATITPATAGGFWVGTEGAGRYRISRDGRVWIIRQMMSGIKMSAVYWRMPTERIWMGVFNMEYGCEIKSIHWEDICAESNLRLSQRAVSRFP